MIDTSKQYRTVSNRPVRIYATDGEGAFPVHGAVLTDDGWESMTWAADGVYGPRHSSLNLVEVAIECELRHNMRSE